MAIAGIALAFLAFFGWGLGDFFIQRSTRGAGVWNSLFFIGSFGAIVFLPFVVLSDKSVSYADSLLTLGALAAVAVTTAIINLYAFKLGKMSIIAPILGLELPLTVALGVFARGERLTIAELSLSAFVFVGIVLATVEFETLGREKKYLIELGVFLGLSSAVGLALTNYLVGVLSEEVTPVFTIWFTHSVVAVVSLFVLIARGELTALVKNLKLHKQAISLASILDNMAWLSYASATLYIPIAIVTTISEGYIALAALLGVVINHEKLHSHQAIGITVTIASILLLSYVSGI